MPECDEERVPTRVLAVRQDNNGDVALIGPALRALSSRARVSLVHGPSGAGAAHLLPDLEWLSEFRADWIEGSPRAIEIDAICRFVSRVAEREFREAFIFTSSHQSALPSALLLRMAGIPSIHAISVDDAGSLLDTRHVVDDDLHEVERALSLVAARGYLLPDDDAGQLRFRDLPLIDRFVLPFPYVVVQPGASVRARTWAPLKWWTTIANLERRGYPVVVVGSTAERELGAFVSASTGALDLCGQTSFGEFAAIVRDARAILTGNTSGIHVAGAVGTPVITVFPPTIPLRRFAPWRIPYIALGAHDIACAGCRARECPIPDQPCLDLVSPEDALGALLQLGIAPRARSPYRALDLEVSA